MSSNADAAKSEADEKDSSIYDFSTYAEGVEGVRLLIQSGFDGTDLWLVGKGRQGERSPLGFHGIGNRIKSQGFRGLFWGGVLGFARNAGPQILMMHGNSVEAAKAHGVLVEHTNGLIEEYLQFR